MENIQLPPCEMEDVSLHKALSKRRSWRKPKNKELTLQDLSNILWCANGVNATTEDGHIWRTAPSARNQQEIDVCIFTPNGAYLYEPEHHKLQGVIEGDYRNCIAKQQFVGSMPYVLCLVANYAKMKSHKGIHFWKRYYYSLIDTGYVSQNIYLYCAANKLHTVAVGMIKHRAIKKLLQLRNARPILCMPVG